MFALVSLATTPFSYQFYNSDGTAQTNPITMIAWPPSTNAWTVYGTNIIWGSYEITLTPNASGFGTNHAYPNTYLCFVSNLNSGFYAALPDTTNMVSLGTYLTTAPQVAGPVGFYGMITNLLGFAPSTNSLAGIVAALGYTPPTNTYAGLTNAAGVVFATNSNAGIVAALGYTPATNTYAAATNLLSFIPTYDGITNKLGFGPATNTSAGLIAGLGYTPLTNSYAAMTNTAGFVFATNQSPKTNLNVAVTIPGGQTNTLYISNGIVTRVSNP
jgi:hypothetical protein